MNSKRICPVCQTTKFRKSTDSGLVCKYGHKVLGVRAEQAEDDGFGGARGVRRKAVVTTREINLDVTPAEQQSDYLLITQFTLQVLSKSMVERLNFPPELEATVRELWLLYISDSKKQITEAYLFEAYENEVMDKYKSSQGVNRDIMEKFEQEEIDLDNFNDDSDSSFEEEQERRKGSSRNKWPSLVFSNTLSFIYLACIYLNYPILPNDLIRWSHSGDIPYLKMQERISPQKLASLSLHLSNSMIQIPTPGRVKDIAFKYSRCYLVNCKLKFPDFNIPLYLERFCGQFFLPVEGYYYAQYIFESYREKHFLDLCIANRRKEKVPATTILMACVIASVKLIYAIGDNHPDTLSSHSEFNINLTKEMYINRIKENILQWKKISEEQNDLNNIIRLIRDTSVASRISAPINEKNVVILNSLHANLGSKTIGIEQPSKSPFMDTSVWVQPENNVVISKEIIQGESFYSRRSGLATNDYLNVLELATLVTGEITSSDMETALQDIDILMIRNNPISRIKKPIYKKLFKSIP